MAAAPAGEPPAPAPDSLLAGARVPAWLRDPLVPLRAILLVVLAASSSETWSDADLWGHVRFGDLMLASGAIPRADPYSFTSDRPWTNHEWLAEVILAGAYRAAGPAGLIALRLAVLGTVVALCWRALRPVRHLALVHDVALAAIVLGVHGQTTHVRPQLFSVLLFTVLLVLLDAARHRVRALGMVPLVFLAWVNLHGGWIVGGAILFLWAAGECVERLRHGRPLWPPLAAGAATLAATLVNPYGVALAGFLHQTVDFGRADIQEWQPVYALGPAFLAHWLFVLSFVGFVVWRSPRPLTARQVLLLTVLAAASFRLARVIGFFAVGSVLVLLPQFDALAAAHAPVVRRAAVPAIAAVFWLVAAGVAIVGARQARTNLRCIVMRDRVPEAAVVSIARTRGLQGRMLTWFDWGQYAIWHLYPALRVSYDGRRETVYSDRVIRLHDELYRGTPAGLDYLRTLDAEQAWLPAWLPVVQQMTASGWRELFRGPVSVLLTRTATPAVAAPTSLPGGERCFPGP